jgi:hypothetical protein
LLASQRTMFPNTMLIAMGVIDVRFPSYIHSNVMANARGFMQRIVLL